MKNKKDSLTFIDIHAHILPGLDDGPKNAEETEALLRQAWSEGIHTIVATPHYRPHYWKYSEEDYENALHTAQSIAKSIDEDFVILGGNEVFYDGELIYSLKKENCHSMPNGFVLVEFDLRCKTKTILNAIDALLSNDYRPIIAHVERYSCAQKSIAAVSQMVDYGAWIQVNANSISGTKSSIMEKITARRLIKARLVDVVGTDCHNVGARPAIYSGCMKYISRHCDEAYARQILIENPELIIETE